MDEEILAKLCEALELSLSPINETRRDAENYVFEAMEWNGFCSAMLQIAANDNSNENRKVDVGQAAAIQFKNMAEIHWRFRDEEHAKDVTQNGFRYIIILNEDKQYVREHILNIILEGNSDNVKSQLNYAVECIVRTDFPDKWPTLADEIKQLIHTEDEMKILIGLESLKSVAKRYEFEYEEGRKPLNVVVNELFPRLEELVGIVQENTSHVAFDIKNRIADLLYRANNIEISERYSTTDGIDKLISFFKFAIEGNIDESLTTLTEETDEISHRKGKPEWKLKSTAMQFFFRIFQKYGNVEYVEEAYKPLSTHLSKLYTV